MKNPKRFAGLILVLVLALNLSIPAFASAGDTGYVDVDAGHPYEEAIRYCRERELMNGVGNGRFDPDGTLDREMLATVLWRMKGEPVVNELMQFSDVSVGAWYTEAVRWAASEQIMGGYGGGKWGIGDPVTRQDMITTLWRYAEEPWADAVNLSDGSSVSSYASTAVNWAVFNGIMTPISGTAFAPRENATRAQVAAALMNFDRSGQTAPAGSDLVLIHGGTFQMGSPADEPERSSDEVQHSVTVGNFYLSKTELTQREYQSLMGTNPSGTKGDDLPVTDITWYDAIEYCNKLSESQGLTPCYIISGTTVTWNRSANGYRLPTETEWEYAARANTTTPFHFGNYVHSSDANCYNAYGYNNDASGNWVNGSDSYLRRTVEVNQYGTNDYGLYNMHGNVAEWVWDWYGAYDAQASADPTGLESGNAKVVRGGGWNDHPKHIRSAYRGAQPADVPLYSIGMRLVRSASDSTDETRSVYSISGEQKTGRVLIAYFSQTGNTDGLAQLIHEMSGADIFRMERSTPYSSSNNGPVLYGEALDELRAEATPELKEYPDLSQYDTILLGYCNWWSSIPASVRTFLTHYDMSGKTIVPFCSMGGGHFGQTISAVAKLAPNSVIEEGLEVTYSAYDRTEIREWLAASGVRTR